MTEAASMDFFGGATATSNIDNPFFSTTDLTQESLFEEPSKGTVMGTDTIFNAILSVNNMTYMSGEGIKEAAKAAVSVVSTMISTVVDTLIGIVKNSVKMAVFKFGIELCAMGIKSLVEAMLGLKMTPPSIETDGISYNLQKIQNPGMTVNPQSTRPATGYDNPFGNPFGNW